jgi:mono/diheme cytochrome c family protein
LTTSSPTRIARPALLFALVCLAALAAGCRQEMADQPRYDPLEPSAFFPDGRAARPVVAGTVARGQLREDDHLWRGRVAGELAATLPFPVTRELLERGRDRFNIFCAPCHDQAGTGNGMIVRRGYRRPPSLHDPRLREAPAGHFFDVMTSGLGAMPDYAAQIPVADRWAIVAYVRALQLSQYAPAGELAPEERQRLEALPAPPAPAAAPPQEAPR